VFKYHESVQSAILTVSKLLLSPEQSISFLVCSDQGPHEGGIVRKFIGGVLVAYLLVFALVTAITYGAPCLPNLDIDAGSQPSGPIWFQKWRSVCDGPGFMISMCWNFHDEKQNYGTKPAQVAKIESLIRSAFWLSLLQQSLENTAGLSMAVPLIMSIVWTTRYAARRRSFSSQTTAGKLHRRQYP